MQIAIDHGIRVAEALSQPVCCRRHQRKHQGNSEYIEDAVERHQGVERVSKRRHQTDQTQDRRQQQQRQDRLDQIESDVRCSHPLLVRAAADGADHRGHRGADAGTHGKGSGRIQIEHAAMQCTQRDHHRRRTRLDHGRDRRPDQRQHEDVETSERTDVELPGEGIDAGLHEIQPEQQQAQTDHERGGLAQHRALGQQGRADATGAEEGQGEGRQIELETQGRHQPAGDRGSEVGAHHHTERTAQFHDAGADEGQDKQRYQRTRLQHCRGQGAHEDALERGIGMVAQEAPERHTGEFAKRLLQQLHADQEQAEACNQRQKVHGCQA